LKIGNKSNVFYILSLKYCR